jgi:NAD(P)-dependent dehydrogenase (short-subunit alcohol dehydrogenase family)
MATADKKISNQYEMRDPRDAYPKPPFPKQPQDKPGFTEEMQPRPDHGEESYKGFGRLKERKALITGGDSGLGRAVVIAYAREGAKVVFNHLPEEQEDADSLINLLRGEGSDVSSIPGDLKEEGFCEALVKQAHDMLGGLDILVINAGKQVSQPDLTEISSEQFDHTMKTNVYAMFWLTKTAMPMMPAGASIINVSSIQGYDPSTNLLDYATTKFAIRGFTEGLAQSALEKGIRVNAVAPGPFWTPLQPSGGQPQDKVQTFGQNTPMGRPGQPAEIAPTFVFLASQESGYMAGEIIGITGGKPTS